MHVTDLAKKTRFKALSQEGDICDLLFRNPKTRQACRLFIGFLRDHGGRASPQEVSKFGFDLMDGLVLEGFRYNRKNFYRTVLRRLVEMGFLGLSESFERGRVIRKYAPIHQPIPLRAPGGRSFWRLSWELCLRWNCEFERTTL